MDRKGKSILEQALKWHSLGLTVLPCRSDSKALLKGYSPRRTRLTIPDYLDLFQGGSLNGCLVTGQAHDGRWLTVLDFDFLPDFFKFNLDTYTVITRRGRHAYFWTLEEPQGSYEEFEIKGNGSTVMLPSSKVDGFTYSVIEEKEVRELVRIDEVISGATPHTPQSRKREAVPRVSISVKGDNNTVSVTVGNGGSFPTLKGGFGGRSPLIKDTLPLTVYLEPSLAYQSNSRFMMAYCPAHDDDSPSLSIDTFNNLCSCFNPSCVLHSRRGFDVIGVHAILNHLSNSQAAEELAKQLGLE